MQIFYPRGGCHCLWKPLYQEVGIVRHATSRYYHAFARDRANVNRPTIFTISATWDDEASVWSGHCDDIPAAADARTLDELLSKISSMTLELLPDNHPNVDPASVFLQITALREAEPMVA